jgi:hypothetical protein
MSNISISLDFYTVGTSSDGVPVETLVYSGVKGNIETRQQIVSEKLNTTAFIQMLIFYPYNKILLNIITGMKAKLGTITYTVQYEETYSGHQEIYFRKDNL